MALGSAMALGPATAAAGELSVEPFFPQVIGGEEVELCGWPNTVAVIGGGGLCTGSLVHPQVVVYAAHCGEDNKQIRFGEDANMGITRQVQFCMVNPDYGGLNDQAHDWAFCVLQEPITDLPFTPPAFGCELDALEAGLPVVIAGFGDAGVEGPPGIKRWGMTQIVSTLGNTANIGGAGISTCQGDSGGSSFMAMADGSWRALSMTSTGLIGCEGTTGVHALMHPAVPWIEEHAGIDITPCHDLDGTWNPTPNCDGFFAGGATGHGAWGDWCSGTPSTGPASTCGEPYDAVPDPDPPLVTITSPLDGEELPTGSLVTIAIDAVDEGYGVQEVWVEIAGQEQPVRDGYPPYAFADVPFPDGVYEIVALASDWAGNVGMSAPVTIGINAEVPDPDPDSTGTAGSETGDLDGTSTTTGSDGDDSTGSTGPGASDDGGGGGCGCQGHPGGGSGSGALVLLGLLGLRRGGRRRERVTR
ncbi:MAG: trypsin-like serine protease [Myxococcales bacterium]|nr:trypsin-like serine protease [Myxococcales bacterium]